MTAISSPKQFALLEHEAPSPWRIRVSHAHLRPPQATIPFGGLTFSRCTDALIRQDLLDSLPYVRRHICGDWGNVRSEHRRNNEAALELGGYLLSHCAISEDFALCISTEADRNLTAVFMLDE